MGCPGCSRPRGEMRAKHTTKQVQRGQRVTSQWFALPVESGVFSIITYVFKPAKKARPRVSRHQK